MKFSLKKSAKAQKGFTLVELSVVVLVAGLMLTAVMKGQSMIEGARAQKLLNDVKNVEALIGQFVNQKGRLPGDCNRDGIVDFNLSTLGGASASAAYSLTGNATRASKYAYTGAALTGPTVSATTAADTEYCPDTSSVVAAATEGVTPNLWINDLRNANVISRNTTNRLFAKHVAEDFIFVGQYTQDSESFNAISVANVPVAMAKRILMNVNGSEANSGNGQMRVIDSATGLLATADLDANNAVTNLIYFYRNQPKPLTGS